MTVFGDSWIPSYQIPFIRSADETTPILVEKSGYILFDEDDDAVPTNRSVSPPSDVGLSLFIMNTSTATYYVRFSDTPLLFYTAYFRVRFSPNSFALFVSTGKSGGDYWVFTFWVNSFVAY